MLWRNDKSNHIDFTLLIITLVLTTVGFIMIFSASAILAQQRFGDNLYFLKRQLLFGGLGLFMMFLLTKADYRRLRPLAYPLLFVSILLLILVYVPGIGLKIGGARRWIHIGHTTFQPSEIAKLSLTIYMAYYFSKKRENIREFKKGVLPVLGVTFSLIALIYPQPDFGSAMFLGLLLLTFLFIAGARYLHLGLISATVLPFALYAILHAGYRYRRFISFLNPWKTAKSTGFQIIQSFISFGSGGLFGKGLGNGQQKLFFLPAPHTDFIFSVIAEELGFVGVSLLIILFMLFISRGFRIAYLAQSHFASYLALGITLMIGLQAMINLSVVMGLLPTKGITLPFISYGGSSLLITLIGVGILLSISKRLDTRETGRW